MSIVDSLVERAHSPIRNYAMPGLTSWMITAPNEKGAIRMFTAERETVEFITPHSHRFDFSCHVLGGWVRNTIWKPSKNTGDLWLRSTQTRTPEFGKYETVPDPEPGRWYPDTVLFNSGSEYGMKSDQVHSIRFGAGARVLFFEGPQLSESSVILQPWAGGEVVPTFKTEPWMFKKE